MNGSYFKRLLSLKRAVKKRSLEKAAFIYDKLKRPADNLKIIHIAGSNGKGSVSYKIYRSLVFSGYKVGLFTSPHISFFSERIQINETQISKSDIEKCLKIIFEVIDVYKVDLIFFEIVLLLALLYFNDEKIDFAVLETGLGGRLDPTNIITPILTIITTISLDHISILGNNLDSIAKEKAGIIKKEVPLIVSDKSALKPILEKAFSLNCETIQVSLKEKFFDGQNTSIAKSALNYLNKKYPISSKAILEGVSLRPSCRFEIHNIDSCFVVLDVAHNIEGVSSLIQALNIYFSNKKFRFVLGMLKDKDVYSCLDLISKHASFIHLVLANTENACSTEFLGSILQSFGFSAFYKEKSIYDAVKRAIKNKDEVIVVCGSFYIMDEAKKALI